jgi:hypothetical protein
MTVVHFASQSPPSAQDELASIPRGTYRMNLFPAPTGLTDHFCFTAFCIGAAH